MNLPAPPADAPAAAAPRPARRPGFDLVRGVALIGVVVMNYHGYLNFGDNGPTTSWAERLFDISGGPLTTRFAATFVMIAGVGAVLMTNRSRLGGDPAARQADRWRLIRRGVLLSTFGYTLNWMWDGTILFFYGAYFIVAALIFTLRIRWIALIGGLSVLAAWAIQSWQLHLAWAGDDPSWWYSSAADRSYKGLLLDVFVNGTHPLFPWLAFFCTGMIIGRLVPHLDQLRGYLIGFGLMAVGTGYAISSGIPGLTEEPSSELRLHLTAFAATDPFSRMPLYVLTTWGSSIVAVLVISWLGDRYRHSPVVDLLQRAGQMTLSLYVLHVLVFNSVVNDLGWITPAGLDTALVFALTFWVFAIVVGAWWNRVVGRGPLEVLYRRFGG